MAYKDLSYEAFKRERQAAKDLSYDAYLRDKAPRKGDGIVTAGPITGKTGYVTAQQMGELAAGKGGLKRQIQADIELMRQRPQGDPGVTQVARKLQSPGAFATAADIALSNIISPISPASAEAATERALERHGWAHDPGESANLFGSAAVLGDIVGNVAASRIPAIRGIKGPILPQMAVRGVEGAVQNAALGAAGAVGEGQSLEDGLKRVRMQAALGLGLGAGLGGLAARSVRGVRPSVLRGKLTFEAPPDVPPFTPGLNTKGAANVGATAFERGVLGQEIGAQREYRAAQQRANDVLRLGGKQAFDADVAATRAAREERELIEGVDRGRAEAVAAHNAEPGIGATPLDVDVYRMIRDAQMGRGDPSYTARLRAEGARGLDEPTTATAEDVAAYQAGRDAGVIDRRVGAQERRLLGAGQPVRAGVEGGDMSAAAKLKWAKDWAASKRNNRFSFDETMRAASAEEQRLGKPFSEWTMEEIDAFERKAAGTAIPGIPKLGEEPTMPTGLLPARGREAVRAPAEPAAPVAEPPSAPRAADDYWDSLPRTLREANDVADQRIMAMDTPQTRFFRLKGIEHPSDVMLFASMAEKTALDAEYKAWVAAGEPTDWTGAPPRPRPRRARKLGETQEVRRAPDFAETHNYIFRAPDGTEARFFRDPENGWWYEANTGRHYSENFLGFKKEEAVARLRSRSQAPVAGMPPDASLPRGKTAFDLGGATWEGLKYIGTRAGASSLVGGVAGAALDEENRLAGFAKGMAVGGAIGFTGHMGTTARALYKSKGALQVTPAARAAYDRFAQTIDFTRNQAGAAGRSKGWLKDTVAKALSGLVDSSRRIRVLGEAAERGGMPVEASPASMRNNWLNSTDTIRRLITKTWGHHQHGMMDPITHEPMRGFKSFEAMMKPFENTPAAIEQAWTYAVALRKLGRAMKPGEAAKVTGGNMQELRDAETLVAALGKNQRNTQFAEDLAHFTDGLAQYALKSGLWTLDQYNAIRASDVLYVPFKRVMDDFISNNRSPGGGGGRQASLGPGVERFKGSGRTIENPAQALLEYAAGIIRRSDSYRVGASVIDAVEGGYLGELGQGLLTKIDANHPAVKAEAINDVEQAFRASGVSEAEARGMADMFHRMDEHNPVIWKNVEVQNQPGTPAFAKYGPVGYTKQYYIVNDPELYRALGMLNMEGPNAGIMLRGIQGVLAPFRALKRVATVTATGINPRFALATNPLRDTPDVFMKQPGVTPKDVAIGFIEAVKSIAGRSDLADEAARHGLGNASLYQHDVNPSLMADLLSPTTVKQKLMAEAKRAAMGPLEMMERVGAASDLAPRLAAYNAVKRAALKSGQGGTGAKLLGARAGARATVDFRTRPGWAAIRAIEQVVPFFGASLKSVARFGEAAAENPRRVAAMATLTGLATVMEMLYQEAKGRREQDVDRTASERSRSLRFGKFRLPMTQEQMVIASGVRLALAQLKRDDPDALEQFKQAVINVLPAGVDAASQLVVPVPGVQQAIEVGRNKTVFGERPIESEKLERILPQDRRYETTAPTFDALAAGARKAQVGFDKTMAALGLKDKSAVGEGTVSPLQAEHVMRGLFNQFTPAITAVTDVVAGPLMGRNANQTIPTAKWENPLSPTSAVYNASAPARSASEGWYYQLRAYRRQVQNSLAEKRKAYEAATDPQIKERIRADGQRFVEEHPEVLDDAVDTFFTDVDAMLQQAKEAEDMTRTGYAAGQINAVKARQTLDRIRAQRQQVMRQARDFYRTRNKQ